MDLTILLWLTLHVRSKDFPVGPCLSEITEIPWHDNILLKALIRDTLRPMPSILSHQGSRIDPSFTAKNLRKICRLKIKWTANLKDHLSYDVSSSTLRLFPHKVCVMSHLESCQLLPADLLSETLRTLDLLFPYGEQDIDKFVDETSESIYRTSSRYVSRATNSGEFVYRRKQLEELHDIFHQEPRNFHQMWHDRRNPLQWWTFWLAGVIAVLTIVFGAIAFYADFKQVVAEKTYRLAVLQACSQTDLPMYCKST